MSASELLVSMLLINQLFAITVAQFIWVTCVELLFMSLQNHPFIKKFEGKDLDLRTLVESLEPPMNIPE